MSDPETHPSIVLQLPQTKSVLGDLRQCHLRCSDVAVMIVVFVLIGVAVALVLFPNRDTQPATMFTLEHVQLLGIVDNRVQRMAYRAGLVLLAIFFLAALYFTPRGVVAPPAIPFAGVISKACKQVKKYLGALLITAVAALLVLNLQGNIFNGTEGRTLRLVFLLFSLGLIFIGLHVAERLEARAFTVTAWTCIIAYIVFLTVPAFFSPIFLSEPLLTWAEWHYSVTLAQGDRLAAGLSLGNEISLNYGLIPSLLLAIFERRFGSFDFAQHIRLVQASQLAFLVTAVFAYRLWVSSKGSSPLFAFCQ